MACVWGLYRLPRALVELVDADEGEDNTSPV